MKNKYSLLVKPQKSAGRPQQARGNQLYAGVEEDDRIEKTLEERIKLADASFDPRSDELTKSWWSQASYIVGINPYPNGISFSQHKLKEDGLNDTPTEEGFYPDHFALRYRDTRDYLLPEGKYNIYKEDYILQLEGHLSQLRKNGSLEKTVVIMGHTVDPFWALEKKFEVTMNCLGLLENYKPGMVVLQTRAPMIIAALPFMKYLEDRLIAVMQLETFREDAISHYTPGQATVRERLVACEGLRAQGIKVQLAVTPILPYGEYYRDAWNFAAILNRHADYISLGCLASGQQSDELALKALPLAQKLAADDQFKMLRPHAYRHLYFVLKSVCPEKMNLPVRDLRRQQAQMNLFAA